MIKFKSTKGLTIGGMPLHESCEPSITVIVKYDDGNLIRIKTESRLSKDGLPVILDQIPQNINFRAIQKVVTNQKEIVANNKARGLAKEKGIKIPEKIKKEFKMQKQLEGEKTPAIISNILDSAQYTYHKIVMLDTLENHPEQKNNIRIIL